MSKAGDELPTGTSSDVTDMQVLQRLLLKDGIELHTRNNGGVNMTIVDQATQVILQEFGKEPFEFVTDHFTGPLRENMAAEEGWRAGQIVNAIAAAVALKLNRGRNALEDAFGDLVRK